MNIQAFVFNPFYENTYVLWDDTAQAVIVDPGCYEKYECQELADFIAAKKLVVKRVINTHCHIDHVLGNYWATDFFKCPLWIPENEVSGYHAVSVYAPQWGIRNFTEATPEYLIKETDTIQFGETILSVIEAPGHSQGHQLFYLQAQHMLIGGDVLFRNSIGRTDLPGGNHEQLLHNIKSKLYTLPDETTVYPGHGPTTTIGFEKRNNPFVKA